jgi:hypothetical protein
MGDIDTNLFGEKTVELDTEEIEKAKKEIASKGTILLKVAPQMPSAEDIGRSRSLANRAMREAEALVVKDLASYKVGCDLSLACAQAIKAIEKPEAGSKMAEVQKQKDNANSIHKFFTGLISSLVDPYKTARDITDRKVTKWNREEIERKRKEAEEKARKEEKERADEKLRLAVNIESIGTADAKEVAEAILAEPVYVERETVVAPKVAGSTQIPKWTWEVIEKMPDGSSGLMALLKAIVAGKEPASLVQLNTVLLGQTARQQKEAAKVEGIRFYDAGTVRH